MKNKIIWILLFLSVAINSNGQRVRSSTSACNHGYRTPTIYPANAAEQWLVGGAIMLGWRKNFNYRPLDIATFLPERLQQYATQQISLPPRDIDAYLNSIGMIQISSDNRGFTRAQICDMLARHGPIWLFGFNNDLSLYTYIIYGSNTTGSNSSFRIQVIAVDGRRIEVSFSSLATDRRILANAAYFPSNQK